MGLPRRSAIAAVEVALAALVLAIAVVTFTDVPQPYPTWPTVGPFPADPELVVPALLAVAVLVGAVADVVDGRLLAAVPIGALCVVTLWIAASGWYTLYGPTRGGVFFGGLFSIVAGTVLAVAVLVRVALRGYGVSVSPVRRFA